MIKTNEESDVFSVKEFAEKMGLTTKYMDTDEYEDRIFMLQIDKDIEEDLKRDEENRTDEEKEEFERDKLSFDEVMRTLEREYDDEEDEEDEEEVTESAGQ